MNADSIHFPDSLKVQTKKLKRTVYGGGGIMPDYFVPIDTTLYTDYHRKLVGKGVIIKFTMKFIEDHRKELADKYKKFDSFNEKFVIDDDMLATLREMGEKEGVKFNEEQYQKALPLIKTQLKALIARDPVSYTHLDVDKRQMGRTVWQRHPHWQTTLETLGQRTRQPRCLSGLQRRKIMDLSLIHILV